MAFVPETGVFRSHPGVPDPSGSPFYELYTFVTAILRTSKFAMPLNMPRVLPRTTHYPGLLAPHREDNRGAVLEFARSNMSSNILMDPLEGEYKAMYTADEYWYSTLTHVPMQFLPFFSHCTGGFPIGLPPSGVIGSRNYQLDANAPFRLGHEDGLGGSPVRRKGVREKCNCDNIFTYEEPGVCGGEERLGCTVTIDQFSPTKEALHEIAMTTKPFPLLEVGSTEQYLLASTSADGEVATQPDFLISNECLTCAAAGYVIGQPYPALRYLDGQIIRMDGWDSRVPVFYALEHPIGCNIVPDDEIVAIGEWDVFYTGRTPSLPHP